MIAAFETSKILDAGLTFLEKNQLKTGGFSSLSTADAEDFSGAQRYQTVFSTALVLQNLSGIAGAENLEQLKRKLAAFLFSQKSLHWSWNYWDRNSPEAKTHPYPDDLDDTFCALTALQLARPNSITGEVLAHSTHLLTALEVTEGGPYTTWLVGADAKEKWRDIDLGVNLNIGYFLHLNGVTLPNLTRYYESALAEGKITTPYYPRSLPILFFASRFLPRTLQKSRCEK